jgi:hypothetical protein
LTLEGHRIVNGEFFMKILLLGAGGFIGANLAERLVNDGRHEITALDIEREKLDETLKSGASEDARRPPMIRLPGFSMLPATTSSVSPPSSSTWHVAAEYTQKW